MPCVQAVAKREREEHIRRNRRDVNEFDGITDPVEALKIIHKKRKYDPLVNWIPHPTPTDQLYAQISEDGGLRLADYAESLIGSDRNDEAEAILLCLAAFTNVPLDGCLTKLVRNGSFWPSLPFRQSTSALRDQLMKRVEQDDENRNLILLALAWIGDEAVVKLFARWKDQAPGWRESLYIPPHEYAREAGWELTEDGHRRDLYFSRCTRLLGGASVSPDIFRAITDSRDSCPWCRQDLTNLVTLSLPEFGLSNGLKRKSVQVTTCEVCTAFGTVFGEFGEEGRGRWSTSNSRPEYLPDDSDDWGRLPRNSLHIAGSRPALCAADQFLPTTFSQVGGHPTWIQDACYPNCPSCTRTMMFLAQIDKEDIDDRSEGVYYAFVCLDCRTTATNYQQT